MAPTTLNATNHRAAPRSGLASCCTSLRAYSSSSGSLTTGGWRSSSGSVSLSSSSSIIIVIVIVGVSRRHRVAHDGDEFPLGRGKVLRDALGHGRLLAGCRDIHARMLWRGARAPAPSYGLRAPREYCAWKKQSGLAPIRVATKHRARASLSGGDERGGKHVHALRLPGTVDENERGHGRPPAIGRVGATYHSGTVLSRA